MKVVIDCNRVIAALLKDSTTREIIFTAKVIFVAPDFILAEIEKYKDEIMKRAKITEKEYTLLIALLFENIVIIQKSAYDQFMQEASKETKDPKDIPYLAVCIAVHAIGIWTHDTHFLQQQKIKIFSNNNMLKLLHQKI